MKKKPVTKVINVGGVDCPPEIEEKFDQWYEEIHIPMLLKTGEFKRVTRFKRIGEDPNYPKFLMIYEFEDRQAFERYEKHPAMAEAILEMKHSWPKGGPVQRKWRVQYEVVGMTEKEP